HSGAHMGSAVEEGRYIALDTAHTLAAVMVNGLVDRARFEHLDDLGAYRIPSGDWHSHSSDFVNLCRSIPPISFVQL
ncbi:MAG: hypothetical protein DMG81_04855, partial [Acidobacteria bacterium]